MAIDNDAAARVRRELAMQTAGLVILLDRAGGRLTYTESEYQATVDRHGGKTNMAIHMEVVRQGQGEPVVELTLTSKPPANADLPS